MTSQNNQLLSHPWDIVFRDDVLKIKNFSWMIFFGVIFALLFVQFFFIGIIVFLWYVDSFFKKRNIAYKKIIRTYPESFFFFALLIVRNFYKKEKTFTEKILSSLANKDSEEVYESLLKIKSGLKIQEKIELKTKKEPPKENTQHTITTSIQNTNESKKSSVTRKKDQKIWKRETSKSVWDSYVSVKENFKDMNKR